MLQSCLSIKNTRGTKRRNLSAAKIVISNLHCLIVRFSSVLYEDCDTITSTQICTLITNTTMAGVSNERPIGRLQC